MLKKLLHLFISTMMCMSSQLCAEILEINEISTIQKYVTTESLILFNITGTLYQPANTLADNHWRIYFAERVNALTSDKEAADHLINKVKNVIVNRLPKKAVEDITPQMIFEFQKQRIPVFGITQKQMATSYADNFGSITRDHLLGIGINLEHTLSYVAVGADDEENLGYSFAFGILFTNKNPVGSTLLSFLKRLQCKPEKIIMVDNSRNNLENAEATLISTEIKFEGFRYGRADSLKTNFDPILGNIQFFTFVREGKIISDDEALQIKQDSPKVDYTLLLDNFIFDSLSRPCA